MILTYVPSRPFMLHQLDAFRRSADKKCFGLWMEQRCGKTKVAIDTAAYLYEEGEIDAMFVLAPNSVKRSWAEDHLPADVPDRVPWHAVVWDAGRIGAEKRLLNDRSKRATNDLDDLLVFSGLAVLVANHEALLTENLKKYLGHFLRRRRTLLVVDEVDEGFSRPGNPTYRTALHAAKLCPYRRVLTGTPSPEGNPLDMYSQVALLDKSILGFDSFTAFKAHHAEYEEKHFMRPRPTVKGGKIFVRETYPALKGYLRLDELREKLAPHSVRVTRAEISDAPDKTYSRRFFELTKVQRRAYDELRDRYVTEVAGRELSSAHALARLTRLQQITCNLVPFDEMERCAACLGADPDCAVCDGIGVTVEERAVPVDPKRNPRLETLSAELRHATGQAVIWCRFRSDVTAVLEACRSLGRVVGRYDGDAAPSARDAVYEGFRRGTIDTFVGTPGAGGRGLDLAAAGEAYYYSNSFSLRHRSQSEDRTESLAKTFGTAVVDIVAEGTVDERIVSVLREKRSLAAEITGDKLCAWL